MSEYNQEIGRADTAGAQRQPVRESKPSHPGAAARELQSKVDQHNRNHGHPVRRKA